MTNAEKFLKDGVDITDFIKDFKDFSIKDNFTAYSVLAYFLTSEAKPTLSEDEKAILRSLSKRFTHIGRGFVANDEEANGLYLKCNTHVEYNIDYLYHDLFQFIKSYQEYKISDLLEE